MGVKEVLKSLEDKVIRADIIEERVIKNKAGKPIRKDYFIAISQKDGEVIKTDTKIYSEYYDDSGNIKDEGFTTPLNLKSEQTKPTQPDFKSILNDYNVLAVELRKKLGNNTYLVDGYIPNNGKVAIKKFLITTGDKVVAYELVEQ